MLFPQFFVAFVLLIYLWHHSLYRSNTDPTFLSAFIPDPQRVMCNFFHFSIFTFRCSLLVLHQEKASLFIVGLVFLLFPVTGERLCILLICKWLQVNYIKSQEYLVLIIKTLYLRFRKLIFLILCLTISGRVYWNMRKNTGKAGRLCFASSDWMGSNAKWWCFKSFFIMCGIDHV